MADLMLKPGKERSVLRRHPWIFAGSVARRMGRARPGDTVTVVSESGQPLAKAGYSPTSKIRARVWSFDPTETIDDAFFKRRVANAVARRSGMPELAPQEGMRLIHGESDGLPGIVADRYRDTVVLQLSYAGAEKWRAAIAGAIVKATGCTRIYERSDLEVRALEGLGSRTGWLHGDPAPEPVVIEEHGVRFEVDIFAGHKTGFYLDQRDNRLMARNLSAGRSVLNCFCYSGAFSLQALAGGARRVHSIDSSGAALELARRSLALNPELPAQRAQWHEGDVFLAMRALKADGARFDLIILDPPKFAPSTAHAERAARAYKDINLLGLRLLNPRGLLMTFSCSGGISSEFFQDIVAGAALDASADARIVRRLGPGEDHPVALAFPEGEYLKGLLCQVD